MSLSATVGYQAVLNHPRMKKVRTHVRKAVRLAKRLARRKRVSSSGSRTTTKRRRTENNTVTAAQWTTDRRVRGRKLSKTALAIKSLNANLGLIKYQYRGFLDQFEKETTSGTLGYFACANVQFTVTVNSGKFYACPIYMLHVSGAQQVQPPNSQSYYGSQSINQDIPLWQLFYCAVAPATQTGLLGTQAGNYYWLAVNGQNSSASGLQNTLFCEQTRKFGGYTANTTSSTTSTLTPQNCVGARALQSWTRLRLNLWGCTGCVAKWSVCEMFPRDQAVLPENNTFSPSTAQLISPSVNNSENTAYWQSVALRHGSNPISSVPQTTSKAWRMGKPYYHTSEAKTNIEVDTNANVHTLDIFTRVNKIYKFDQDVNVALTGTGPQNTAWTAREQSYEPAPTNWRARRYYMISCKNYGTATSATAPSALNGNGTGAGLTSGTTTVSGYPSFDINYETVWRTL